MTLPPSDQTDAERDFADWREMLRDDMKGEPRPIYEEEEEGEE